VISYCVILLKQFVCPLDIVHRIVFKMMLKSAFSSKASPVRGRERTVPELRDPVSLTSDSLNKLNGKFQFKRDSGVNTSLSYQHIPVQEAKGKRTKVLLVVH